MNSSYETLQKRYLELTEARYVLKETAVYFEEVRSLRYSICALGSLFNDFPYQAVSRQDNIRHSFDEPSAPLLDQDVEQGGGGNVGGGESQPMTLGY